MSERQLLSQSAALATPVALIGMVRRKSCMLLVLVSRLSQLRWWVGLALCMGVGAAWSQAPADPPATRASAWLLEHAGVAPVTTAVHWRSAAQRPAQHSLREAAQQAVAALTRPPLWAPWFARLEVTGRLPLVQTSPRALQVLRREDPTLAPDDVLVAYPRPQGVAVLGTTGAVCWVPHAHWARATDYLAACGAGAQWADVDWVWWVAPNGDTGRVGVLPWNRTAAPALAPGAWLWAPSRQSGLVDAASDNIARFLATQAPLEFMADQPEGLLRGTLAPQADDASAAPRTLAVSSNDWGETGLLQTPSARMMGESGARLHFSHVRPYTRGNVFVQPFDWLEAGFRYTDISNRMYGAQDFSGRQTYKDKSIDARVRLHKEDAFWPQVVLGLRDVGGTGLFSSEYVVASKRWDAWDFSLGLGWGGLGGAADGQNPLRALGRSTQRQDDRGAFGGTTNTGAWFTGPVALFGGVQVEASPKWLLKAELDGQGDKVPQGFGEPVLGRVNVGAVYRQSPELDWHLSLQQGRKLGLGLTLHTDVGGLQSQYTPKLFDAPLPSWGASGSLKEMDLAASIARASGWHVLSQEVSGHEANVVLALDSSPYLQDRLEGIVRLMHGHLPPEVSVFRLHLQRRGLGVQRLLVDRALWVARRTLAGAVTAQGSELRREPPDSAYALSGLSLLPRNAWSWRVEPNYHQVLGGPNGFVMYQLGVKGEVDWAWSEQAWVSARAEFRALDNYGGFVADAPDTGLPKVRSDLRPYLTSSRSTLPLLQVTRVDSWGQSGFSSVYGGYLESMYAGVGGEWLWQPWEQSWAVGLDLNHVAQRDFNQGLGLRPYRVNTGHLSVYADTGVSGVEARVSLGRYLAGDWGATLDLSRRFANGVAMGLWATKTNVSAQQFGEGSFDKGFYINIPFDALMPKRSPGTARLVWNPLTRDGGARLQRRFTLRELLAGRSRSDWRVRDAVPHQRHSGDVITQVQPAEQPGLWRASAQGLRAVGRGLSGLDARDWLWAAGAVALGAALDQRVNCWVGQRDGRVWQASEALGKAVPYALAAGAGLLWLGDERGALGQTARASVVAGLSAYGLNQGLRYVVGRARPREGLGNTSFDGFRGRALQSGFASNHTALAFALATPFAENHGANWLYGAAALTGLSRLQSGDHWLSDVVAGGLLGYATGHWVNADARARSGEWVWRLGWRQVSLSKRF